MIQAEATARYVRTSAQKAGLVLALIRGKDVNRALATLKFTRKGIADDIAKVLRSAIANAQNKDGFSGDVDRLFVSACYANQGPSQKRVRPALAGSYEALFHFVQPRSFLLTWHEGDNVLAGLRVPRLERAIGVIYRPETERQSHYFHASLPDQFDAVLHFDETRAIKPLESTAEWEAGEVPETFPFAV